MELKTNIQLRVSVRRVRKLAIRAIRAHLHNDAAHAGGQFVLEWSYDKRLRRRLQIHEVIVRSEGVAVMGSALPRYVLTESELGYEVLLVIVRRNGKWHATGWAEENATTARKQDWGDVVSYFARAMNS